MTGGGRRSSAVVALRRKVSDLAGQKVALVLTGGNVEPEVPAGVLGAR